MDDATFVLQDPVLIAHLRARAREVAEHIDWESIFDQVKAALLDVIRQQDLARL